MLSVQTENLNYHRLVVDQFNEEEYTQLKDEYDYSFVISYGDFVGPSYETIKKNAILIDLNGGIEKIQSTFNATVRNEIRKFDKINDLTLHHNIEDKAIFFDFYATSEKARGWYPVPAEELFNSLVFYVCFENKPISGISVYTHNNRMRVGRIFSLRNVSELENASLLFGVAAKKIIYEFCKYGAENNYSTLDLGGIDLNSDLKSGITNFKLSFSKHITPVTIGRWSHKPYDMIQKALLQKGLDLT